jgi:hypothetical protein
MKAILEFNLPEDQEEFDAASKAWKYRAAVSQVDRYLRDQLKYNSDNLQDNEYKLLEALRTRLYQDFQEHDVELY